MKSLATWMMENGKTAAEVARLCAVRDDTVNGWLHSNRHPTKDNRRAIRRMTAGEVDYPIPELAPEAYRKGFTPPPQG
jgi:DNA-binding transcriptional regulator YdaS (Cro superfamily)